MLFGVLAFVLAVHAFLGRPSSFSVAGVLKNHANVFGVWIPIHVPEAGFKVARDLPMRRHWRHHCLTACRQLTHRYT